MRTWSSSVKGTPRRHVNGAMWKSERLTCAAGIPPTCCELHGHCLACRPAPARCGACASACERDGMSSEQVQRATCATPPHLPSQPPSLQHPLPSTAIASSRRLPTQAATQKAVLAVLPMSAIPMRSILLSVLVAAAAGRQTYELVKEGVECASTDKNLGDQNSLDDCAAACADQVRAPSATPLHANPLRLPRARSGG